MCIWSVVYLKNTTHLVYLFSCSRLSYFFDILNDIWVLVYTIKLYTLISIVYTEWSHGCGCKYSTHQWNHGASTKYYKIKTRWREGDRELYVYTLTRGCTVYINSTLSSLYSIHIHRKILRSPNSKSPMKYVRI